MELPGLCLLKDVWRYMCHVMCFGTWTWNLYVFQTGLALTKLNIWWVRKGWAWYWLVFASQPKSYSCILTTCYLPLRSYWGVVGLILFQITATDSSAYMFNCGFSFMIKGLYKILIESFCLCLHTCISKCAWKCKVYVLLETLFT